MLTIFSVEAQNLIVGVNLTDDQLTSEQLTKKQKYSDSASVQSIQLIQVGDVLQTQQNGLLSVVLPGGTDTLRYQLASLDIRPNGDYSWYGNLENGSCRNNDDENRSDGIFFSVRKEGATYSEFSIDTQYYSIRELGGGLSLLTETKLDYYKGKECALPIQSDSSSNGGGNEGKQHSVEDRTEGNCPVRILVLYTQAALDARPDVAVVGAAGVSLSNEVLYNSKIKKTELKFILVGPFLLQPTQWFATTDVDRDRSSLRTDGDIATLRQIHQADIVVVITPDIYSNASGAATAFGDTPAAVDSAFAVIEVSSVLAPNYTFTHELGHLFGTRHQRLEDCSQEYDNSGLSYAHGENAEGNTTRNSWKTIMTTCSAASAYMKRYPYFSTPHAEIKGCIIGNENTNFNAKVMKGAACRVANYRTLDDPDVHVFGANKVCPGEGVTLTGTITGIPLPGPFRHEWSVSLDGGLTFGSPTVTISSDFGDVLQVVDGLDQQGDIIVVRLVAGRSPNGPFVQTMHTVRADSCGLICWRSTPLGKESVLLPPSIMLSPNPARNEVVIAATGLYGLTTFTFYDGQGKLLRQEKQNVIKKTEFSSAFYIGDLPEGLLWVKCQNRDFSKTLRVVHLY